MSTDAKVNIRRDFPSEYQTWFSIKGRCFNKNNPNYQYYGGRGITVCDRWLESFENFFEDMGPKPTRWHSIDRYPDNDGHYEPGNCRWATPIEQANNKRNNVCINHEEGVFNPSELSEKLGITYDRAKYKARTAADGEVLSDSFFTEDKKKGPIARKYFYKGQYKTIRELSELSGKTIDTLNHRISHGLSVEEAVDTDVRVKTYYFTYKGETLSLNQLAEKYEKNYVTLVKRLKAGLTIEQAIEKPLIEAKLYEYQGRAQSMPEWAREYGVNPGQIHSLMRRYESFELAMDSVIRNQARRERRRLEKASSGETA